MKRISFSIFLAVVFILMYYAQPAIALQQEKGVAGLANLPSSNVREWSKQESEEIAEQFLRNSPTFVHRGIEDSLTLLNTTPLEQSFSWQFEYEFECSFSGYGRLGDEPTPIVITPHRAEIVVQEGKVIYAVLDDEWDILAEVRYGTPTSSTDLPEGNHVMVDFLENCEHNIWVDSFANSEVTAGRRWRISHIDNTADETGEPVRRLKVTLDTDVPFDSVVGFGTTLINYGPPTYEWFYPELVEQTEFQGHPFDASLRLIQGDTVTFTPGFDVSRSFDKTVFTTPGTQTVTVTFTKREETFDRVLICVGTMDLGAELLVDAVIISHSDEWYNEYGSDEHYAEFGITNTGIPVELDTPLTITVTIQVTPKVPEVSYKPHIHVAPCYPVNLDSSTVEGSSFSYTNGAGTWTVSADGNYVWTWRFPTSNQPPRGSVDLMESVGLPEFSWSIVYGTVAAAIVIIGLCIFFFIRRRRRRTAQ